MAQKVCGIVPRQPPQMLPSYEHRLKRATDSYEGFSFYEAERSVKPSEMADFIRYLQKYADIQPRTYWYETPFYRIFRNARQRFCLGNRPEDLEHLVTIEKRSWEKHLTHLNRLEHFPLDKAEYYIRLKESRGVNSVRELGKLTGEDWSYIAKILRTLELSEPIKDFLRSNKNNPTILQFFHLRKLLDIVRQGEERLQLGRFGELMQEFEESSLGVLTE